MRDQMGYKTRIVQEPILIKVSDLREQMPF